MEDSIKEIVIVGKHIVTNNQKNQLGDLQSLSIRTLENSDVISELIYQNILLIINLSNQAKAELESLIDIHHKVATIIVVGDKQNATLLNLAISADISAFLDTNHEPDELKSVIDKTLFKISNTKKTSTFNVFINAKGGAGASFICSNIAYVLSKVNFSNVALVDMDLQFGSLGLNFNINAPKYTIIEALNVVKDLDKVSLPGYMEKYTETLNLLLPSARDIVIPGEVNTAALEQLLIILENNHSHLIIDLPKLIDPLSMMILDKSKNIVIVLQQNLAQFRDGRRLIQILNKDLDIPLDKIIIIINRYDPDNSLKRNDMVKLINHDKVYTIRNDFDLVASTTNLGVPLCEHSPNSKIAKELTNIAYTLGNVKKEKKQGILSRFFK